MTDSFLETDVGPEVIAKIKAIVASHPEGIMVEQIREKYGFANANVIWAALNVLRERGEIDSIDPFYGHRVR